MTTPTLSEALAELRATDPRLGEDAEVAFSWLVGEADEIGELGQARLQEFLWYVLPRKFVVPAAERAQHFAAMREAIARVFTRLDHDLLAAVCRSAPTLAVHEAYLRSEDEGLAAARSTAARSGLEPPDLDGFAWGDIMGMTESRARDMVESALQQAIVSGELVPGRRGWEAEQRRVTAGVLDAPDAALGSAKLRDAVMAERVEGWCRATSPRLAALRRGAAHALIEPVAVPAGLDEALGHLSWFIRAADEGIKLTERGNLNRAFVQQAVVARGWESAFTPYREWDVPMLEQVHDTARELRAVRRRGRMLHATQKGRAYAADPGPAWHALVTQIASGRGAEALALEVLALMLLAGDGATSMVPVQEALAEVLADAGFRWQDASPQSDAERAGHLVFDWRTALELFAMGEWTFEGWPDCPVTATPFGMTTLRAVLRERATVPVR